MDWYYAKDGEQVGPVAEEELKQLFENGQVSSDDLVWNESQSDWLPIGSFQQFSPSTPDKAPSTTVAAAPASPLNPVRATTDSVSPGQPIPTYLWQSIVCLVLCCLPAAIPAIVYSTKVDPAVARGDYAAAKLASDNAKLWCWVSFGIGIVANILIFGASAVGGFVE